MVLDDQLMGDDKKNLLGVVEDDQAKKTSHEPEAHEHPLNDPMDERRSIRHTQGLRTHSRASSLAPDLHHESHLNVESDAQHNSRGSAKEVLRDAFVSTPIRPTMAIDVDQPDPAKTSPLATVTTFRPRGALPTGFPEPRDLNKDVQASKIPVKGQSRFSKVDVFSSSPLVYHDTTPLPPSDLLAHLRPTPQILIYGDGLPYPGFLRSFSIADLPNFEWNKLAGLTTFVMLPSFAPFEDEPPFYSHKTVVKQIVSLMRFSRKNNKTTILWLAYCSRANVADSGFATLLDRRIDLIPALSFLNLSVVCPIPHLAARNPTNDTIEANPSPLDHPLIIMQLTSAVLPKEHTPKTVELFPKQPEATTQSPHLYCPQASLLQLRIDIPSTVTLNVEGTDVVWNITGTLQLMLLLNGLSPDDTSTVLKGIVAPRITKQYWPIPATSAPDGFRIFDFHVPLDVLSRFYEGQDALSEMHVSLGLLHDSVEDNALIITHQPRFQKNAPKKKKMPSNEIRDAIELNSSLRKKFSFIVLLKKKDIFCMVHEQMLIQPAVQEIENLGDMIVVSATTQHRITAREVSRTVAPPFVLVRFPPIYAIPDIIRSAATFGPVDSHQIFQQSGILLVKYQSTQSAAASYGATLPGPVYFTSGTDHDTTTSIADRLQSVSITDLPSPLLNEANLAAFGGSELSPFNMPDLVSGGDVSPVPSIQPDHSARASDHRMSDTPPPYPQPPH